MDVREEGATSDAGNHWVPFQPSGKVKNLRFMGPRLSISVGFQVLLHHSLWARGCRQALTVLVSICQPQHNVITDTQMKHHCYVQALWAEAKCAGDQTVMTCQSHAPPLKSLCRETDSAASLCQMLLRRGQGRKCQWWADELQVCATLALIKLQFAETSSLL